MTRAVLLERQRADLLWFVLNDLMTGVPSALSEAEVLHKMLKNEKPAGVFNYVSVEAMKRVFRSLPRSGRVALIEILQHEHEVLGE